MLRKRVWVLSAVFLLASAWFYPANENPAVLAYQTGDLPIYLPAVSSSPSFAESFSGDPARPLPWHGTNWDIAVHSRDRGTWDALEPMQAEHGLDCSPPPSLHPVTAYEDTVFQCRNHVMTAINASGYGAVVLTPNQIVDFSKGEAVIRFDVSTLRKSGRDWIDLWITPYEDNLQIPVIDWIPDLNGEPRRAVAIAMGFDSGNTTFQGFVIRNFMREDIEGQEWRGYEEVIKPSAMRRDTFELRISRSHIRFGMPDYNWWWIDADIPALDWSQGIVQFGHHSYTPAKDCAGCGPNTWHWDNIFITPAAPFIIEPIKQRTVTAQTLNRINLASPARENSHLRFSGIGQNLEVSFDDGKTWLKAPPQQQERYKDEAFWTYWMPVPTGATAIRFRGQDWWGGAWRIKDMAIWTR